MRILHIDTGTRWRGGQQQLWWLLEGLQRMGLRQRLATTADSELARRAATLAGAGAGGSLEIIHLNAAGGRILSFANARIVRDAARGCDLIHAHDAHAHTLAWGAQRLSRGAVPPMIVARRVTFPIPWLGRLKNRYPAWFIAVSEHVRQQLIASGIPPAMTRVVHDGVLLPAQPITPEQRASARQKLKLPEEQFVLGTLSSLAPEKMLDDTLRWVATLPGNFCFLLGVAEAQASSEQAARLRELAASLSCTQRFHIVPVGTNATSLLAALDTFIYFSKSEGLGSAILLAMAHGLPVVASRTGGIPEIVEQGETGLLINTAAANWQEMASAAVRRLASDPGERNWFGTRARAYAAAQASSDNMVARTAAIYREILAARAEEHTQT